MSLRASSTRWAVVLAAGAVVLAACPADDPVLEPTPTPAAPTEEAGSPAPADDATPGIDDDALAAPPPLDVETVVDGLSELTDLVAPEGDDRLFVVERHGTVRVITNGEVADEPFLDIGDRVTSQGLEQGLLSMAFHPADPERIFVHYTGQGGRTVLAEYGLADGDRADPDSEQVLLTVEQPAANHNGGRLGFGPDGMLYLALGDGGGANDRFGQGQDPTTLLATMVRIDVSATGEYEVPDDNPFADGEDGAPEVWAYGLRNPYRFAFDGDLLYIADVGQNEWEWVNVVAAAEGGLNHGWPITEGSTCFDPPADCPTDGLVAPALEYPNQGADCAIIGGFVYRGDAIGALRGHYLYSDYCGGWLRSFAYDPDAGSVTFETEHLGTGSLGRVYSFGQDGHGELYVLTGAGAVLRIVEAS